MSNRAQLTQPNRRRNFILQGNLSTVAQLVKLLSKTLNGELINDWEKAVFSITFLRSVVKARFLFTLQILFSVAIIMRVY